MLKLRDVLSRWERRELSMMEAGEPLGMSERQFRRYRERFEEEGEAGLIDRRLGKPSPKRIKPGEIDPMLGLNWTVYRGWNVRHFHEHGVRDHKFSWGYTWTKTQLHAARLVERAKRRGAHRRKRKRKPCEGMMLHQDGSQHVWLEGQPPLDLIVTMDDATSTIYSALLAEQEGTASTLSGLLEVSWPTGCPARSTPIAAATTSTPTRLAKRWPHPGGACARSAWRRAYPGLLARGARPQRADVWDAAGPAGQRAHACRIAGHRHSKPMDP
jgi:hypothetical protein